MDDLHKGQTHGRDDADLLSPLQSVHVPEDDRGKAAEDHVQGRAVGRRKGPEYDEYAEVDAPLLGRYPLDAGRAPPELDDAADPEARVHGHQHEPQAPPVPLLRQLDDPEERDDEGRLGHGRGRDGEEEEDLHEVDQPGHRDGPVRDLVQVDPQAVGYRGHGDGEKGAEEDPAGEEDVVVYPQLGRGQEPLAVEAQHHEDQGQGHHDAHAGYHDGYLGVGAHRVVLASGYYRVVVDEG